MSTALRRWSHHTPQGSLVISQFWRCSPFSIHPTISRADKIRRDNRPRIAGLR